MESCRRSKIIINNCEINGNIIFPSADKGIIKNSKIVNEKSNNYLMGYFESSTLEITTLNITPQAILNNCKVIASGQITVNSIHSMARNPLNGIQDFSFILMLNSLAEKEGFFISDIPFGDPPIFSNRFFNPNYKGVIEDIITYKGSSNLGMIPFYGNQAIYIFDILYNQWITVESSERESIENKF